MSGNKKNIILRSEEVQDILSRPPHYLVRWGTSVIGAVMAVLLIGCFVFKYPDKISCKATITKINPPAWIIAKSTGKIKDLLVADGMKVSKDEIIAVIENPADTKEIIALDGAIGTLTPVDGTGTGIGMTFSKLGDIQEYYNSFVVAMTDYNNFTRNNLYDERIRAEETQLKPYTDYVKSAERQLVLSSQQDNLNEHNYNREKALHEKRLTSASDLETAEQVLLSGKMSLEQMRTSLANTKIQVAQIQNNISELRLQKEQERKQVSTALQTSLESLKNAIRQWKQNYVLASPTTGIVSYNNIWKVNQNVSSGDKVFSVISSKSDVVIAKAKVPVTGSGKIRRGQRVNIKLDGYPYLEYGFMTGKVLSISSTPDEDMYTATIEIKGQAVTSYGRNIRIDGELTGIAEIITDDLSIGERLIYPLRYLLQNATL